MFKSTEIFKTHYDDYYRKISQCNFDAAAKILKVELKRDCVIL